MDHQFHYVSNKQAELWLALHQHYSPSRTDPDCEKMYDQAFQRLAVEVGQVVQVIGLGCGGGRKDAQLLSACSNQANHLRYVAADVSPTLVTEASTHVEQMLGKVPFTLRGLVADFMEAPDLGDYWNLEAACNEQNVFSFLGMLPNFEPKRALGQLAQWVRSRDFLVLSANLAPGSNYVLGCEKILPLYDNDETRLWLLCVMEELGFKVEIADLEFFIAEHEGVKRVEAWLIFSEATSITYQDELFRFEKGERFRLFYSNRFQPEGLNLILEELGWKVVSRHVTASGEEGVWVVGRS